MCDPIRRASLWLALLFFASTAPAFARDPRVGQTAPDFELTLFDGQKVNLADLRGEVIVINFWATWCVPCRAELPTLDAYYNLQKRHGLRVFAITTEGSVPERKLRELFGRLTLEPVHRLRGPYRPLSGVPTNYVIDRAGKVRYAAAGAFDLDKLNELLVPLLNEPRPPVVPTAQTALNAR